MQKKITNNHGVDLPIAVWLLTEGYYNGAKEAPPGELISVTTMMKPTRSLILQRKVDFEQEEIDVADLVSPRFGHSIHDSMERAWTEGNWQKAMKKLHYPQSVIDRIRINPDPENLTKDEIPIFLEKRGFKEVGGIVLTGQLDFSIGGAYRDTKTTSTFAYTSGSKDQDYILQGSLYRYIMPEFIWKDKMKIEFIFTDWAKYRARADKNYPQAKVAHKEFPLMSIKETEEWLFDKIAEIKKNAKYVDKQDKMIRCTDKELWKSEDSYKYYVNPETAKKNGRATKRFDNQADAYAHRDAKGKGVVVVEKGQVKACPYCPAFSICEQRREYFDDDQNPI